MRKHALLTFGRRLLQRVRFPGSASYWEARYTQGGNSGSGSYGHLAQYKNQVLNRFVADNSIELVVELGCGDGNQLRGALYPRYVGYDVSPTAVSMCQTIFAGDMTKRFEVLTNLATTTGDLALSLDVIYHLVEDAVFDKYMERLTAASSRFLIIYSSSFDARTAPHVRHRDFRRWMDAHAKEWKLVEAMQNPYSQPDDGEFSLARFYVYRRDNLLAA